MSYVMVPVPEEHVRSVMRYVLHLIESQGEEEGSRRDLQDWDEDSMRSFFEESDEITRALLSYLSHPDHAPGVRRQKLAQSLELQGYLPKVLKEVRERCKEYGRPSPVVSSWVGGVSTEDSVHLLGMKERVAQLVRSAERALHQIEAEEGKS